MDAFGKRKDLPHQRHFHSKEPGHGEDDKDDVGENVHGDEDVELDDGCGTIS